MGKLLILAVGALLLASQVRAEDGFEKRSIEAGFFSGSVASSSSPIEVRTHTNSGRGVRFTNPVWKDIDLTFGFFQRSYGLGMDEANLGRMETTTFSSTVRFRFNVSERIHPYAGWGLHHTELEEAVLADGSLKAGSASGTGPVAEWGVKAFFGDGFYLDLNTSQYFWSADGIRFETNTGSSLISEIGISNPHWVGISIGRSF